MFNPISFDGENPNLNAGNIRDNVINSDEIDDAIGLLLPELKASKAKNKLPAHVRNAGLKIVPFDTSKHKIKTRPSMKNGTIPSHPGRVIFNGRSNSGKSNLIVNLLTRPEFYGKDKAGKHYFDEIYLFSPTAGDMDDLCIHLLEHTPLTKKLICNDFDEDKLTWILDKQQAIIEQKKDISKAPKVLIILDDVQSDAKFLRSKIIKKTFLMGRHFNTSVWISGQSFNLTPRSCRMQASDLFIFPLTGSEDKVLRDEFKPSGVSRKDWDQLIQYCLGERYQFLRINMANKQNERFGKNLDEEIELKDQ